MELGVELISLTLLTFVSQVISQKGLQLIVEPQDVVVEQGAQARLDCVAESSLGEPSIQWRTDDGQTLSFIGDDYRSKLANGSLYISSVYAGNPELAGGYHCLASIDNVGAIVSRTATIKLASLPGFEREPQDTMVYPGQVAYLSCALPLSASPLTIQWLKDEHPLSLDESRMTILPSGALEIDHVQSLDIGSYRCNASGLGQHRLSNKAQLDLLRSDIDQGSTPPIFIAKPSRQVAIEGTTITLECAANGSPKPTILWLKDGIAVDLAALDSRYRRVAASSLMISDIREKDHGSYQCRAENDVETLDAVAEVSVQVPPKFIKKPQDKFADKNQDLELECKIYGKPEPKVTWLKNGERIKLNAYWQLVNGYNLRINGLLLIDAGIFQCIGTNPAGSIQASARLTINQPKKVTRKPNIPKRPPKKHPPHRELYNKTFQHPSTLVGYTLAAFAPNPDQISTINPSDHGDDIMEDFDDDDDDDDDDMDSIYDPNSRLNLQSRFIDDTDTLDNIEGSIASAPRDLNSVIISTRFVTLKWREPENPNGEILSYYVYYKQEGSQRERIFDTYHNRLEGTISSLQPSMRYQFRVVALNARGPGASSSILHIVTQSEADVPGPPMNFQGHATSSYSVALTWEEPLITNGRIIKYIITDSEVSLRTHGDSEGRIHETTATTYELVDLVPFTEYNFVAYAVNENGTGALTNEITVRTFSAQPSQPPHNVTLEAANSWSMVVLNETQEAQPSSPPRDLTVQSVDDHPTTVVLHWQPPKQPNGPITGYVVSYTTDNTKSDRDWRVEGVIGDQIEIMIKNLQPSTIHYFKIQARNTKGYGPFSSTVPFTTLPSNGIVYYDESHASDGRGLSNMMIYIIVGLSVVFLTGVAVAVVVTCCRRSPESPDHKKGYTKDSNQKTNIKPPDLWIHHDQMELKALEKSSINGEASTSGVVSNTLPRSGNQDYNQDNMHINSSSLDKRTYVPSYMGNNDEKCSTLTRQHNRGSHKPKLITLPVDTVPLHQPIATATPIVNSSLSQPAIHNSCADVPSVRPNYPRTVAQYSLSRAHVTLEPTPESSPDSCSMPSTYEPLQTQIPYSSGNPQYGTNTQYTSNVYGSSSQPNSTVGVLENSNAKRLQGHPLKSFSVPAPPPQSAPSTPAQQKHGVSQVTVRPTISGSPYKKPPIATTQITKNRLASVVNPSHTAEEVERLKPSYSTEELNQEMANLEGLMKDLNAITASEFEC